MSNSTNQNLNVAVVEKSKPIKQRLAIFLDGTWNTEDDSTNVLNAYHNTFEGTITEKNDKGEEVTIIQKRYYDQGVGTTMADNVRGGSYGMGLEKNVREAYNWLIDNYNGDGENDPDADEIYIFGFSRGAYTARSLVGLIGACGLVKRGAPLTVTQLWNGYAFISKNRGNKNEWWETELKKDENKNYFGRLSAYKYRTPQYDLYNKSEELLYNWSKRVKITFLGIYDTVGAMGIHALGIPGLRSKLDSTHNLNPTKLIQRCRHALAIDEHRTNFRITPILNYIDHEKPRSLGAYKEKILQRWFVGAHSNIGGGYENNVLSVRPYDWIMAGASDSTTTHLKIIDQHKQVRAIEAKDLNVSDIRDSYEELAGKVYPHIFRSKRHFRPIGRTDVVRSGNSLSSINEDIDPFVYDLLDSAKEEQQKQSANTSIRDKKAIYAPLNLMAYLMNKEPAKFKTYESLVPQHKWPGELMSYTSQSESFMSYIIPRLLVVFWSLVAGLGLINMTQFFWGDFSTPLVYSLSVIALVFILADWGEHKVNLARNFYPKAIKLDTIWNILYWIRLFSILSFIVGFVCLINFLIIRLPGVDLTMHGVWEYATALFSKIDKKLFYYGLASTLALTFILDFFGKSIQIWVNDKYKPDNLKNLELRNEESKNNNLFLALTIGGPLLGVLFLIWKYWDKIPIPYANETSASRLILIFILIYASTKIIEWVGKPMGKFESNIGTIITFQTAFSKTQISNVLNSWLTKLNRAWLSDDDKYELKSYGYDVKPETEEENKMTVAWLRLREILRKAIWRDIIGFVPLYSFIMGVILWTGSAILCCDPGDNCVGIACFKLFDTVPLWLCLILTTAILDQIENGVELMHIDNHPKGGSNIFWRWIGIIATSMKYIGFFTAAFLSLAVIIYLCFINIYTHGQHWKWILSNGIIYIGIALLIFKGPKLIYNYLLKK